MCNKPFRNRWSKRKFCSITCANRHIWKGHTTKLNCATCGIEFDRSLSKIRGGITFCSKECKIKDQKLSGAGLARPAHYGNGFWSYRQRAFDRYGKKCTKCGYTDDERMLDVDHIDNNRRNSKIENLRVLCLWCHGLKTRNVLIF